MVETGTSSYYTALGEASAEPVLQQVCRLIAADEYRHFKLFYDHLKRYLARENLSFPRRCAWRSAASARARTTSWPSPITARTTRRAWPFDHARCTAGYMGRAMGYYRYNHIERSMGMVFKSIGLQPRGRLSEWPRAPRGACSNGGATSSARRCPRRCPAPPRAASDRTEHAPAPDPRRRERRSGASTAQLKAGPPSAIPVAADGGRGEPLRLPPGHARGMARDAHADPRPPAASPAGRPAGASLGGDGAGDAEAAHPRSSGPPQGACAADSEGRRARAGGGLRARHAGAVPAGAPGAHGRAALHRRDAGRHRHRRRRPGR
jgi:hypothetical protein